jgi:cytochrome c-type biogenesis protein CcmH
MANLALTLRRFAGRCPPRGLTSLGAALREVLALMCLFLSMSVVSANEAAPAAADPVLDARMMKIASELRCLVCQNQTIADSHADLAIDLRAQVRELLQKGQTNQQITDYMTARYGDFVLYRPPFKNTTALLWVGPGVMLVAGLLVLVLVLRRRSRMPDARFEADEPEIIQAPQVPDRT